MKRLQLFLINSFLCFCVLSSSAQRFQVNAGPVYGHYTDSTTLFWMRVHTTQPPQRNKKEKQALDTYINQFFVDQYGLELNYIDQCKHLDNNQLLIKGQVKWERETKKDIQFLVGSCALQMPMIPFFWNTKRENIYLRMLEMEKDFMIWMGDNVYYLFGQWKKNYQMHKVNIRARKDKKLSKLLANTQHYATWDDHDYGPNNSDRLYPGKFRSLEIFKNYWPNPSFGTKETPGVFFSFTRSDASFFVLDTRFYAEKGVQMIGKSQMDWLKKELINSTSNFKFIVSGTQILGVTDQEDFEDYGSEKEELLSFLSDNKISGIVFLSGDRHYAELLCNERPNDYPLYEFTCSPLTSPYNPGYPRFLTNRVDGTFHIGQNFGRVRLEGSATDRICILELYDFYGALLWSKEIPLEMLKYSF